MIAVVGSHKDEFYFDDGLTKVRVYHDDDPQSTLYNEMCGHRHLLTNWETYSKDEYCGLEHYRRAFDLTPEQIKSVLKDHEVIVKEMHGPYEDNTNLTVLSGCSRYGINYFPQASAWVNRWKELKPMAGFNQHYGCNMFIASSSKYKAMADDIMSYVEEMLKYPMLPRAIIGYFAETILTPYVICKHNKYIYIAKVVAK